MNSKASTITSGDRKFMEKAAQGGMTEVKLGELVLQGHLQLAQSADNWRKTRPRRRRRAARARSPVRNRVRCAGPFGLRAHRRFRHAASVTRVRITPIA